MNLETVASSIRDELERSETFQVVVFWIEEPGDRDLLRSRLDGLLQGSRAVSHVLRRPLFIDPNGWAADAMNVIEGLKDDVLAAGAARDPEAPLGLVIIARSKLAVAQSSSPAQAPMWLAPYGGLEIAVAVRDVRAVASCSLASPEAAIGAISTSLYQLEHRLLTIAERMSEQSRHHGQKLWGEILKERSGLDRKAEFFDFWRNGLGTVNDAPSYT